MAGIKGTTFVLSDDGTTSTLQVIDGEVQFTSKATGKKSSVVGGSMVSATSVGLGKVQTFDVAKETTEWDTVSTAVKENTVKQNSGIGFLKSNFLYVLAVLLGVIVIFFVVRVILKRNK